jgi:CubicO group peptidase (beta-lactamase class C family)
MAAAIQAGVRTPSGNLLSLETPLSEFFPYEDHMSSGPAPFSATPRSPNDKEYYAAIKLKHLFMMGAGMSWDETYESDPVKSSFMPMLYGVGHDDMVSFALRAPMVEAPGMVFDYSGGNTMFMMAMLRKIFSTTPDYDKKLLFGPLGMNSALFERDPTGAIIGCSYSHMEPEDMLKLGYLYLNDGVWNGNRILPEHWVERAQTLSDTLTTPGNKTTYDDLKSEGTWSNASFWLNKPTYGNWTDKTGAHQTVWGPEMKKSPSDLFFAAGHYGQLILIIPSEDMVIVRTAHDSKYWDNDVSPIINKIDPLVSSAISCFKDWQKR